MVQGHVFLKEGLTFFLFTIEITLPFANCVMHLKQKSFFSITIIL